MQEVPFARVRWPEVLAAQGLPDSLHGVRNCPYFLHFLDDCWRYHDDIARYEQCVEWVNERETYFPE